MNIVVAGGGVFPVHDQFDQCMSNDEMSFQNIYLISVYQMMMNCISVHIHFISLYQMMNCNPGYISANLPSSET